jgi:hypothetical protein
MRALRTDQLAIVDCPIIAVMLVAPGAFLLETIRGSPLGQQG